MDRSTYHHGDLRNELVRCGRQILKEEGLAGLTLRSITRAAGVSHGAPRNEFGDMNGLLAAIAVSGFEDLLVLRQAAMKRNKGSAEFRLKAALTSYVDFARSEPGIFGLMFGPQIVDRSGYPELVEVSERSYGLLKDAVYGFLNESGFGHACRDELVQCVWSTIHGVSMLFSNRPSGPNVASAMDFKRWRDEVVRFALAGLIARSQN